jgi:hypothetical protein
MSSKRNRLTGSPEFLSTLIAISTTRSALAPIYMAANAASWPLPVAQNSPSSGYEPSPSKQYTCPSSRDEVRRVVSEVNQREPGFSVPWQLLPCFESAHKSMSMSVNQSSQKVVYHRRARSEPTLLAVVGCDRASLTDTRVEGDDPVPHGNSGQRSLLLELLQTLPGESRDGCGSRSGLPRSIVNNGASGKSVN